jgi:deferrochelatase/peroxidase EfeB
MAAPEIDYSDVQGTILRGYRVDLARHFILSITDAEAAGALIGGLVDGTGGLPRITTAARWTVKPECFVNIGFTAAGLAALGVTQQQLGSFDGAFQRGATNPTTAGIVGDVGTSQPSGWIGGLADGAQVHVVLSLWVDDDPAVLEAVTARLRAAFPGGMKELSTHDARALPDNRVHFGYRDNIAQPTVIGAPPRKHNVPDGQPPVDTGEFLLGYPNESGGTYAVQPAELSTNSSYAAFRILEQDVAGFETFLTDYAAKAGIDPELLAAKVCGRWRNGNPLELMPDAPGTVLPMSKLNDFQYVSTEDPAQDDTLGLKCPIGSHLRRNNPRNEAVVGTDSTHHRIVRRAMPYGPAYDPAHPDPAPVARGLVGFFINASLSNQFEFLTGQWNLLSTFVKSAKAPCGSGTGNAVFNISGQDVFLGVNDPDPSSPDASSFTLASCGASGGTNQTLTGFSRLITTRGGAYCFLPSIKGLRYLSRLPGTAGG